MTTELTLVEIASSAVLRDGTPAWRASVRVEMIDGKKPGPLRAPSMRVLAQRVATEKVTAANETRDYHEPLYYEGVLYTELEGKLQIGPYEGDRRLIADMNRTSTVKLVPATRVENADPKDIKFPYVVLESGSIPIGIVSKRKTIFPVVNKLWRLLGLPKVDSKAFDDQLSKGRMNIFGREDGTGSDFSIAVKRNDKGCAWIEASLRPEGIGFHVQYASSLNPDAAFDIAVCLTPDPLARMRCRLVPLPSPDLYHLGRRVQEELATLRRGSPLIFDLAKADIPRVFWRIDSEDDFRLLVQPEMEFERDSIAATLMSHVVRGGTLRAAATLHCDKAHLTRVPSGFELQLRAGNSNSTGTGARLSWKSATGAPSEVPFDVNLGAGKPDSPAAFEAVAETKDLQALLTLRYRAAGLISANDTAACAFIPLERGVLQMPLPGPADKKPDKTKEDVPRRCFTGLVFARFASHPAELELTAAASFDATLQIGKGDIRFYDAVGTHTGDLWTCEQTPSAVEILPTLDSGALATRALGLVFGNKDLIGWRVMLAPINNNRLEWIDLAGLVGSSPPVPIASPVAWLPHREGALVSVMPITRTRPAASQPSATRDLMPHPLALQKIEAAPLRLLRDPASPFPSLDLSKAMLDEGHPFIEVFAPPPEEEGGEDTARIGGLTFAALALPGVEVARHFAKKAPSAASASAISLRYDLPLLGELFATAAVPKPKALEQPTPPKKPTPDGKLVVEPLEDPPITALAQALLADHCRRQGDRHSLTRTMQDRVTEWRAPTSTVKVTVTNLVEPFAATLDFEFHWRAAHSLPIGEYKLASDTYFGSSALAGLSSGATISGTTLKLGGDQLSIVGFSPALYEYDDRTHRTDYRGWGRGLETEVVHYIADGVHVEVREQSRLTVKPDATVVDVADSFAVTIGAIPVEIGAKQKAFLRVRDLPMSGGLPGRLVFEGNDAPYEFEAAQVGLALRAHNAGGSVYEWSLAMNFENANDSYAFTIPLQSLRFRPLRLWTLVIDGKPAQATELCVIGLLEPPRTLEEKPLAVVDDEPYAKGPLAALIFKKSGGNLVLQSAHPVHIKDNIVSVDIKSTAIAEFEHDARVHYGTGESAPDDDSGRQNDTGQLPRFTVRFPLVFESGVIKSATTAQVDVRLFGQALALTGGKLAVDERGFTVAFKQGTSPTDASAFDVTDIDLSWQSNTPPKLGITAKVKVAAGDGASTHSPVLVEWTIGGSMQWLGLKASNATDLRISHRYGTLAVHMPPRATDAFQLLRGLDVPDKAMSSLALGVMLSASDTPAAWPSHTMRWGFFSASLDGDGDGAAFRVRHTLECDNKNAPGWRSSCDVSLGTLSKSSTIAWPVDAFTLGPLGQQAVTVTPVQDVVAPFAHTVTVEFRHVALDVRILKRRNPTGSYFIEGGWRIPDMPVQHILARPEVNFTWTSLDEVVVADLLALTSECRGELEHPAEHAYAFGPRYIQDVELHKTQPNVIPRAGVLGRAFARAGLPTWEIAHALASVRDEDVPASLVVFGCSTIEVATMLQSSAGPARGATIGMPWIAPLNARPIGVLASIPQWSTGLSQLQVAGFDAANSEPHALDAAAAIPFATGNLSHYEVRGRLDALYDTLLRGHERPARTAHMPVTQAIALSPEDSSGFDPTKVRWLERPIFWRTLIGWQCVARAFPKDAAFDDAPPFARHVVTLVPAFVGGKSLRVAVLRLAVSSDDSGLTKGALEREVLVLSDLVGLRRIAFPDDLRQLPERAQGPDAVRLRVLAYAADQTPRVAALAQGPRATESPVKHVSRFIPLGSEDTDFDPAVLLRSQLTVLPASPALGWPRPANRLGLSHTGLKLGEQTPMQDSKRAWAGEALAFSVAAKAWEPTPFDRRVAVLALSQRIAFRRPLDARVLAPPDRALHPVPPRVRMPGAAAFQRVIASIKLPSDHERTGIAPMLPGRFEAVTTGRRPGVPVFEALGLVLTSEDRVVDENRPAGGRMAERGSVLWYHSRAPRSTALPPTQGSGIAWDLGTARRTYAAIDQERQSTKQLLPFLALRRPMTLLRYDHTTEVSPQGKTGSLRIAVPQALVDDPLTATNWQGTLTLGVTAPRDESAQDIADILAVEGLLPSDKNTSVNAAVRLAIGGRSFSFANAMWTENATNAKQVDLQLSMKQTPDIAAEVAAALRSVYADAPAFLSMAFGPMKPGAKALEAGEAFKFKTDELELRTGPPTVLSLPIPAAPSDRMSRLLPLATVVFGDPAYDRELASKTQSDSRTIGRQPYLLAADRREYDTTSSLYFQCGEVTAQPGTKVAWTGNGKMYAQFEYIPFDPAVANPIAVGIGVNNAEGNATLGPYELSNEPYGVALAALRRMLGTKGLPIDWRDGDRVAITAWPATAGDKPPKDALTIRLTVVAEPVIAPPASVYGFLTRDWIPTKTGEEDRATAALFASAPLAQRLEFPKLSEDLALGQVRRNALFIWNFVPRTADKAKRLQGFLLKIDRTGGGQLADEADDFIDIPA